MENLQSSFPKGGQFSFLKLSEPWVHSSRGSQPLPSTALSAWVSPFLAWHCIHFWGAIVGLKGQHTLKCFESSLSLAAASREKGLSTQRAWAWTARGSVLLKVTAASLLLPCLGRHGGVPFPEPSSASSPSAHHQQQSWEWVPVLAFGGICSLGSYLHWCWSPRFLAMTMKIPFYFPQIPPAVEVSFLFIPVLIWTPCILLSLPGIWKGEITE